MTLTLDTAGAPTWVAVCTVERILPDTGVAALVAGRQVAVFRLRDGRVCAIDNRDPCSGANVLSRGIVGDVDGRPVVASPMHKQRFDLTTGECLDEEVFVRVHELRVRDGLLEVRADRWDLAHHSGSRSRSLASDPNAELSVR